MTVKSFLKRESRCNPRDSNQSFGMAERLAKRKKEDNSTSCYIDASFVFGSLAEVERLWSIAKYILSDHRQLMTPQIFEALIFLKCNARFWDDALISQAYNIHRAAEDTD